MPLRPGLPAACGLLVVAALAVGCGTVTAPDYQGDAPLQTDRLAYQLQRDDNDNLRVEIPFTYHNRTGKTVYLVNCNGNISPDLEKWQGGEWVLAWSPIRLLCLSAPIEIAPGEVREYNLHVFAASRGSNTQPQFEVPEVDGTYRLLWNAPVHDYDLDDPPSGTALSLADRVSNNFSLRTP